MRRLPGVNPAGAFLCVWMLESEGLDEADVAGGYGQGVEALTDAPAECGGVGGGVEDFGEGMCHGVDVAEWEDATGEGGGNYVGLTSSIPCEGGASGCLRFDESAGKGLGEGCGNEGCGTGVERLEA